MRELSCFHKLSAVPFCSRSPVKLSLAFAAAIVHLGVSLPTIIPFEGTPPNPMPISELGFLDGVDLLEFIGRNSGSACLSEIDREWDRAKACSRGANCKNNRHIHISCRRVLLDLGIPYENTALPGCRLRLGFISV